MVLSRKRVDDLLGDKWRKLLFRIERSQLRCLVYLLRTPPVQTENKLESSYLSAGLGAFG